MPLTSYAVTPADTLVARGYATRTTLAPAQPTPDPIPTYAQVRAPTPGVMPLSLPCLRYVFHDAVVHGAEGPISVGRHLVQETLFHVSPVRAAAWHEGDVWIARHALPIARLPAAEHLLAGNPANYYHWLLDGIARWSALPPGTDPILVPAGAPFHAGLPALLPHDAACLRPVAPHETLAVDRLGWSTTLTWLGGAYHPLILRLRDAVQSHPSPPDLPDDIYVARNDATNRPLRNEPAVARLAASRGFTPVALSGMPLIHQAALFRNARRIVAPHGAGLANLLFCRPGAAILELMMDQYANFCFRRLAATAGLHWGALVGPSEPGDPDWVHGTGWTLDLDRLAATLDDPAFTPTQAPSEHPAL